MVGCDEGDPPSAFVVHNRSGEQLGHLVIVDAGPVLNYAKLKDNETMTRKLPGNPDLPRIVNVYWEDGDGRSQHQKIELWKRINSTYRGPVKLTLERSGNIRVSKTSSI
jgi:hypothetical protein